MPIINQYMGELMTTSTVFVITYNHGASISDCLRSIKNTNNTVRIFDLGSTDDTLNIVEAAGVELNASTPSQIASDIMKALNTCETDFALLMYGYEVLTGTFNHHAAVIPDDVNVALFNTNVNSWVNTVLSTNDLFLEPRLFRCRSNQEFVGIGRLYPVLKPDVKNVSVQIQLIKKGTDDSLLNPDALLDYILSSEVSMQSVQTLLQMAPEELSFITNSIQISNRLSASWDAAVNNDFEMPSCLPLFYGQCLISQFKYDEVLALNETLIKANENGKGNVHATFLSLYCCASSELHVSSRDTFLEGISSLAERLSNCAEDDFAEDTLAGTNEEKATLVKGIVALRLNKHEEALSLFETLALGGLAGIEQELLLIEATQNSADGQSMQRSLQTLEPLLNHRCMADAWLLSACSCVLLDNFDDIKNLWLQSYVQSRCGFISGHRRNVLSGMNAMIAMLDGQPTSGKGAYGTLGAIMSRRPLPGVVLMNMSVIERSVNSMIIHNKLNNIVPLLERRAESLISGINEYVINHLNGLGFPVEDDGELQPIFICGDRSNTFKLLFEDSDVFSFINDLEYGSEEILKTWDALQDAKEQEFDAFSWLDVSDGESEEALQEKLSTQLKDFISNATTNEAPRHVDSQVDFDQLELLKSAFSDGAVIHVIEDPRIRAIQEGISTQSEVSSLLLKWERELLSTRKMFEGSDYRYLETSHTLLQHNPGREVERIMSFLGEAMLLEPVKSIYIQSKSVSRFSSENQSLVDEVERQGERLLKQFGFKV
jgi:hypothetical protein